MTPGSGNLGLSAATGVNLMGPFLTDDDEVLHVLRAFADKTVTLPRQAQAIARQSRVDQPACSLAFLI